MLPDGAREIAQRTVFEEEHNGLTAVHRLGPTDEDMAVAAHCESSAVHSVAASEELCSDRQSKKEDIKTTVRFRVKGYRERGDTALFGFPLLPP